MKIKEKGDKKHSDWMMFFSDFCYFLQLIRKECYYLHNATWDENLLRQFVELKPIIIQCIKGTLKFKNSYEDRYFGPSEII